MRLCLSHPSNVIHFVQGEEEPPAALPAWLALGLVAENSLGFELEVQHTVKPSLTLYLRSDVLPESFCTIMAVTNLGSGTGGGFLCTSAVSASARLK